MDTAGEHKLEMEINIVPPDCHKAKPKKCLAARVGTACSLVLLLTVPAGVTV